MVAAGVSPVVAGGSLPPGRAPGFFAGRLNRADWAAGRDARLYGRQDARRYYGTVPANAGFIH
jgi:hypothetical protein